MKICIITSQILGQEKVGGFGTMAKQLAISLLQVGIEVVLLIPQKFTSKTTPFVKKVDEPQIKIIVIKKSQVFNLNFYRSIDADIYHSQHQTILSSMALLAEPSKKHMVTCIDPRNWSDWLNEFKNATWRRQLKIPFNYLTEESFGATWALKKADLVTVPAKFLVDKVQIMYRLKKKPLLLPLIEDIPQSIPSKSQLPLVIWVGRLAKRKYPETFIKLAAHFPQVTFLVIGKAEEQARKNYLYNLAAKYPNVKMMGYKDKFENPEFFNYLDKAWILINTASREGLPLTFVEAASRACAILSGVNPDCYAEKFGYWAKNGDFELGLQSLLQNNSWREKGLLAKQYVYDNNRSDIVIDQYLKMYYQLVDRPMPNKKLLPIRKVPLKQPF